MMETADYFEMLAHFCHIKCLNPESRNLVDKALITSIMLCKVIPPFAWLKLCLCIIKHQYIKAYGEMHNMTNLFALAYTEVRG